MNFEFVCFLTIIMFAGVLILLNSLFDFLAHRRKLEFKVNKRITIVGLAAFLIPIISFLTVPIVSTTVKPPTPAIKREAVILKNYLLKKNIDGVDAWWLRLPDSGFLHLDYYQDVFLPAISEAEGKPVTDFRKWWNEDGGAGKMKVHFIMKLKNGPPPDVKETEKLLWQNKSKQPMN